MKIQALFNTHVLSMAALLGMAAALVSCSGEETVQGEGGKTTETETDKNLTTFVADSPDTRTTMSNTGVFKWEAGDHIWVKDDNHTWQQSSNAPTSETASFKFMVPGKFTAGGSYTVYYPGKNGSQDQVTISATQSQVDPNTPAHVGVSGDCGWATATAATGTKRFNFTLDHKAAFLVFSPYCNNNPVIQNSYIKLTKIEVISDKDLVGTYTLDPATNQLTSGTSTGTTINLTTGGSATPNGFSVPTAATPVTNASYVVIKPGTHTLKVRFWLKDYVTNVEGTVTKEYPSFVYAANTYYSMPSELKVTNYTTPYYMWDAQKPYWYGHEWDSPTYTAGTDQPVLANQTGSAYPQNNADPRWCNETFNGSGHMTSASQNPLFTSLPNANELSWYVMKGDPHWDGDELWTTMGHLYKGGLWLKKKDKINGFRSDKAADNTTDLRTKFTYFNNTPASTTLTVSKQVDYFYLPALGYYTSLGKLFHIGSAGYYHSSSATPSSADNAYGIGFYSGAVYVNGGSRKNSRSLQAFK